MKKERKMKKLDSHAKSSTISTAYRCCCNFFRQILDDLHDFVSECVSFLGKSTTRLGGHVLSEEKWQFSLDVKHKHTFYRRKSTEKTKFAKVSPSNNNYSFRIL